MQLIDTTQFSTAGPDSSEFDREHISQHFAYFRRPERALEFIDWVSKQGGLVDRTYRVDQLWFVYFGSKGE